MLPVYICDDREEHLKHLSKVIDNVITMEELAMVLELAAKTPQELIAHIKTRTGPALYFLDIELKNKMNGFDLAMEIRKYDPRGFIVFITTHDELAPLTFQYKVEAMDYILKDNTKEIPNRIKECMFYAFRQYTLPTNSVHSAIAISISGKIVTMEQDQIICIEPSYLPHKINIYTDEGVIVITSSMRDIRDKLDKRFYQCHKSCIINTKKIEEFNIKKHRIIMSNGKSCMVAIRMCKKLEEILKEI